MSDRTPTKRAGFIAGQVIGAVLIALITVVVLGSLWKLFGFWLNWMGW